MSSAWAALALGIHIFRRRGVTLRPLNSSIPTGTLTWLAPVSLSVNLRPVNTTKRMFLALLWLARCVDAAGHHKGVGCTVPAVGEQLPSFPVAAPFAGLC